MCVIDLPDNLMQIELPKWSQCIIKGESVTKKQAAEIIKKTTPEFYMLNSYSVVDNPEFIGLWWLLNEWDNPAYDPPRGWCSTDGIIEFHHNIGKYVEVSDIYRDLLLIAREFPFLKMTITCMSNQESEPLGNPMVSIRVEDGDVSFIDTLPIEELTYEKQ